MMMVPSQRIAARRLRLRLLKGQHFAEAKPLTIIDRVEQSFA
jgi:hypothetical protein